jgi:hypothetical protein
LFSLGKTRRVGGERGTPAEIVLVPHGEDQQEPQVFAVINATGGVFLQHAFQTRAGEVLAHVAPE